MTSSIKGKNGWPDAGPGINRLIDFGWTVSIGGTESLVWPWAWLVAVIKTIAANKIPFLVLGMPDSFSTSILRESRSGEPMLIIQTLFFNNTNLGCGKCIGNMRQALPGSVEQPGAEVLSFMKMAPGKFVLCDSSRMSSIVSGCRKTIEHGLRKHNAAMSTRLDPDLITMIRCPVTKSPLTAASATLIERLNQKIEEGTLVNRVGQTVDQKFDGGFINDDQSLLLPVRGGIVILIADQSIGLDGVAV